MKVKERIRPFYQAIPRILVFQLVSFAILAPATWGVSALCNLLLNLSGKAAVTSGNLGFLFTNWQGYVIIALLIVLILSYIAIELNALVLYCSQLLDKGKASVLGSIKGGFVALKKYRSFYGLLLIVYAVFLAPVLGFGFSISLTETFYIPNFITSVIATKPLLMTIIVIALVALTIFIIFNCFIMHGALLDGKTLKESSLASRKLVKRNLKNFIPEMLCFIGLALLITALAAATLSGLPLLIVKLLPLEGTTLLFWEIFFLSILFVVVVFSMLMSLSFLMIKLSLLYKKYQHKKEQPCQIETKGYRPFVITLIAAVLVTCVAFSAYGANNFDEVFHTQITTGVVGHRAGGTDAPENTVKGIEVAYELGAAGCEVDIQRTSDGYYVVNHDSDFYRVADVDKTSSEMTLDEIKELRVDGEPVPTLEESLEAARDKVVLFIELKGDTADERMADDTVKTIKEMGMEDQAVLISLKYDLMEYVEQKYPEMLTGYLAFISLGQIENTPFDYLSLEEEISTDDVIAAAHDKGKKVMVWTVNEEDGIRRFMTGDADAIVTDAIRTSGEIREQLINRDPLEVIFQKMFLSSWQ